MTNEEICLRNLENQDYMCAGRHPISRENDLILFTYITVRSQESDSESLRGISDILLLSCAIGLEKVRQCKEAPDADWPAINVKM